jgi:dihydrolipoamide dehydrogenase
MELRLGTGEDKSDEQYIRPFHKHLYVLRLIALVFGLCTSNMYDMVVIGAGPGGYACAIRAAQLGAKTCIIEKDGMGRTCTQRGCMPTKYLHSFGDIMRRATAAKKNGINASIELDYNLLKSRMKSTVSKLAAGIEMLLKSNNVDIIPGDAQIVSQKQIAVNTNESSLPIETSE